MDSNKAAYWIALGVLALGLNSEYRHGNFVALHWVAKQAGSAACRLATRAEQALAVARIFAGGDGFAAETLRASANEAETARQQAEMIQDETELLRNRVRDQVRDDIRERADAIRARAEMQRAQIEQMRLRGLSQVRLARRVTRRVMMDCPKTSLRIAVNAGPESTEMSPNVEVDDTF
jgi:hypothetical protein